MRQRVEEMQADEGVRAFCIVAASLPIEIDDVLVATMASSRATASIRCRIEIFSASFSVAASMMKSQSRNAS